MQIILLIRLLLVCQCCMICHHDTRRHIWKIRYGSYLNKKFLNSLPLVVVRNYVMELCNDVMDILSFLFWTMWCSFKGPCDVKSFKISTAYNVWFSRYRPLNLMITANFALVLVFIYFLWAVYEPMITQVNDACMYCSASMSWKRDNWYSFRV